MIWKWALVTFIIGTVVASIGNLAVEQQGIKVDVLARITIDCPKQECEKVVSKCALNEHCKVPLEKLIQCPASDSSCQLDVFVEHRQWNYLFDDVISCFGRHDCIKQWHDLDV